MLNSVLTWCFIIKVYIFLSIGKGSIEFVSEDVWKTVGRSPKDITASDSTVFKLVHPSDAPRLRTLFLNPNPQPESASKQFTCRFRSGESGESLLGFRFKKNAIWHKKLCWTQYSEHNETCNSTSWSQHTFKQERNLRHTQPRHMTQVPNPLMKHPSKLEALIVLFSL